MGAVVGSNNEEHIKIAEIYGENLGLAFQIMDDILDVVSDEKSLGKPIGSDAENEKSTFVTLLGLDKCYELVNEYTEKAIKSLDGINGDTTQLKALAVKMSERKN